MPQVPGNAIRPILLFQQPIQPRRADAAVPFVPIADLAPCGIPGQRGRPATGKWGLMLQDTSMEVPDGEGVAVAGVQGGTPAERAGIREGDVILEVNRRPVKSAKEAAVMMTGSDSLLLLVQRNDASFYVALSA